HSQIEFQDLEFLLQPEGDYRSMAVVSLGGNGFCQFTRCVVTLDNADTPTVPLHVVTLLDPDKVTKMPIPEPRQRPELRLSNCVVRGHGNLFTVRVSRPFDLDLDQCLFCLGGSLLFVEANSDPTMPEPRSHVKLNHLTTWLGEPLLYLRAKNG